MYIVGVDNNQIKISLYNTAYYISAQKIEMDHDI